MPQIIHNSSQERLLFVSYVRVISMMLIITFHSLCYYTGIWWFFKTSSIPLWEIISEPIVKGGLASFVCISGFLFGYLLIERGKYKYPKDFFINKAYRLIIPYISGSIILISIPAIHITWGNLLTGPAHLWFLLVLFELFIIFYLLVYFRVITNKREFKNAYYFDACLLLVSFIPVYIWRNITSHHHFLCIEASLSYMPVFLSGFYAAKYHLTYKVGLKYAVFTLIFATIGLFTISYFKLSTHVLLISRIPALLTAISLLVIFGKRNNYPLTLTKLILNFDKHSMGIYYFNQIVIFVMLFPPNFRQHFDLHPYTGPLLLFFFSLLIPWFLSYGFQKTKYLSWFIGNL